ncbi:MAG: serine hydrolase domain-containing protein [Xanthomonadales bacterium]|nr:serine hydrolase domain-containing protein [Xanthomonadales bacterium]
MSQSNIHYYSGLMLSGLLVMASATWADSEQPANPAIDAIFSDYDNDHVPGCALGVIQDGEFIYRHGYGMANLEYGIPIDSETIFRTGSVGKQFTAATIALLAESGAISLNDPLSKYFHEFPDWADGITIKQHIYHTSGIRDYLTLAYLAGKGDDADYYTDDWVLRMLARQQETNFPPGSQYLYSNSGYLLLAHVVKRVSGQSLREYAQQNLFGPLGMTQSHFHDDHTEIVPRRASGYAPTDDGFHISMTTLDMVGDGGVFTSVDELLQWDRNFYNNRLGKGGPELIELLTTPGELNDGTKMDYGFGLSVEDYRGQKLISHGGSFVGFRAEMMRFPELGFGLSVLCNRSDAEPEQLARHVADVMLADRLAAKTENVELLPEPGFTLDEAQLQLFTGDFWEAEEAFAAETQVIDGKLWAVHSPTRKNELQPLSLNRFRMTGVPSQVLIEFDMDGERIVEMRRFINGKASGVFTPFQRLDLSPKQLAAYAGEYFSPELDSAYMLNVTEDKLWFSLDDEGPQELTVMFGETFENPDYGAFTFSRNASGQVTGFKLQSGRVRNLVFNRAQSALLHPVNPL